MAAVEQMAFRDAMAQFPSGVTVVTARTASGTLAGFTASAFSSLSLDPPLVLVCLDKKADSHTAFEDVEQFAISFLAEGQDDVAMRFATRGIDKFGGFRSTNGALTGLPLVPDALVHLECRVHERLPGGDHTIIIGEVLSAQTYAKAPLLHHNRRFGAFHTST